jgi:hypothetical protein
VKTFHSQIVCVCDKEDVKSIEGDQLMLHKYAKLCSIFTNLLITMTIDARRGMMICMGLALGDDSKQSVPMLRFSVLD